MLSGLDSINDMSPSRRSYQLRYGPVHIRFRTSLAKRKQRFSLLSLFVRPLTSSCQLGKTVSVCHLCYVRNFFRQWKSTFRSNIILPADDTQRHSPSSSDWPPGEYLTPTHLRPTQQLYRILRLFSEDELSVCVCVWR